MLAEGSSMAAVARITGIHPDTIMRLAVRIGTACAKIQDDKMRGLNCTNIEVDEIWGFIGAKKKNASRAGAYGDVWTFIALDSDTKLIPSFIVGKRDLYHARAFMEDLAGRLSRRVQLSSDALASYPEAVESGFGSEVDYGQLVKPTQSRPLVAQRQRFGIARQKWSKRSGQSLTGCLTFAGLQPVMLKSRITPCGCTAAV